MHMTRSVRAEAVGDQPWEQRWKGPDRGLVQCWEHGRRLRSQRPDLARLAEAGELPMLDWKGGVERELKKREKFGSLNYLAQWQGLRGEDLSIDTDLEMTVTCSRTSMVVTFTEDHARFVTDLTE